MKRSLLSRVALLAALACLLAAPALAKNHYAIDTDALKALEKTDTFDVTIVKKTVTDGANSGDLGNPDVLTLTVENRSGAQIASLVVLAVAYDDANTAQDLQGSGLIGISIGEQKRELDTLTLDGLAIGAGQTHQLNIPCDHDNFTGVRTLVAQYVTDAGQTVTNPLYPQWQELALGSPTHILD